MKMAIEDKGSAVTSCNNGVDEDRLALLALALTPNLGPKRIADAVRELQCPAQLFALTLTELEGLRFPADAAQFIFDGKARRAAEEEAGQSSRRA
jgi:DNA processing protein